MAADPLLETARTWPIRIPERAALTGAFVQAAVVERLEIQEHGAGWGWRGSAVAEPKGNAKLREIFRRANGDVVRLTLNVWWSDGSPATAEAEWEQAELQLEVPSRKAPQLSDLIAAGLLHRADLQAEPTKQTEWRQAERFLGRTCDEDAGRRHIARCLKPTIRRDRGYVPAPAIVAPSMDDESVHRRDPASTALVLGVRVGGLSAPWFRPRIENCRNGKPSDPDAEAIRLIRDTVPFGATRRLRIELSLPGHRLFCFPLRYSGGVRLPSMMGLAEAHCRRRAKRPILPSHGRVLTHLANSFAGKAELERFIPDADALALNHPPMGCPCGREVPVRRALVAGFPVLVLAAHAPFSGKTAWTGFCHWIDHAYTDLDPAAPRALDEPPPERGTYCLDRDDWWMGMRVNLPPELGPLQPLERQ
ncbi:MAG TPA: hypothetical protein VM327_06935 [Candidatus Thermoplasmatota archaeon]|nr:hypothetical protein [Candidatus Thermoplasmatota archaeon]